MARIGLALPSRDMRVTQGGDTDVGIDIRTDMLGGLNPHQLNAALIERHQARSGVRPEQITLSAPVPHPTHQAPVSTGYLPGTIDDLRDQSDTEMALVWQYAELERQRAENAAILDAADEAMVLISEDHRLANANQRFCDLLGSSKDRLLGLHVHQIRPILLTVFGDDSFCRTLRWNRDQPLVVGQQIDQVYPEPRSHALVVADVAGADQTEHGRLFALRDITDQLELDRMKDDFIATVSHELRTPLTSISGFLDLLIRGSAGELPGQAQSYLGIVQRNVTGLIDQVNELLEFSRLEAGAFEIALDEIDPRSVMTEAIAMISPMVNERHQRLNLDLDDSIPSISADRGRLIQVLVNLMSNANRYTLDGGTITIAASVSEGFVRFDIADTGIGLSQREQELIFTRFYRVQTNANPDDMGSGLGLPIAKSLVERMGGRIWVRSAPSRGSIFSFTIPVAAR